MTANVVHVQNAVQEVGGNAVAQVENAYKHYNRMIIVIKYYFCIYYCIYSVYYVCVIQSSTTNSNLYDNDNCWIQFFCLCVPLMIIVCLVHMFTFALIQFPDCSTAESP